MIARCHNQRNNRFYRYGARGIVVCERWRGSFAVFRADMGPRPSPRHSLDRIDNDGNYAPGNVRWATPHEQGRNRSDNRFITWGGETMCLSDWGRRLGLSVSRLRWRLQRWGVERALTAPIRVR